MSRYKEIVFDNKDAATPVVRVKVSPDTNANQIVEWYAAYHTGDDFAVVIDHRNMPLDINGHIEPVTVTTPGITEFNQ